MSRSLEMCWFYTFLHQKGLLIKEFRSWLCTSCIYFILSCGISHLWKKEQPFGAFTQSPVHIVVFQLYPYWGALGIHWGQMKIYLSCFLCFTCFDVRYHPHLRLVSSLWVYLILRGSFSRKNIMEELSADLQIQKSLLMAPVYLFMWWRM